MWTSKGEFTSNPAGGTETIDVDIVHNRVQIGAAYPLEDPAGGVAARIAAIPNIGVSTPPTIYIRTPATVGGVDLWYCGRAWHSAIDPSPPNRMQDTTRWFWNNTTAVPAASEVIVPHTLDGIPNFVSASPVQSADYSGIDWALSEISATQFKIRNWDAVNPITIDIRAVCSHSIEAPIALHGPIDVNLNGAAPVVITPELEGRDPDLVFAFPYSPLGVQPLGLIVMDAVPDADQVTLRNVAGGNLDARVYLLASHSIAA